jgi:Na+/H+ antiporter NhaA
VEEYIPGQGRTTHNSEFQNLILGWCLVLTSGIHETLAERALHVILLGQKG